MSAFRRVLLPTDFSEFGRVALEHAVVMAKFFGSEVVAIHVLDHPPNPLLPDPPGAHRRTPREIAEHNLARFIEPASASRVAARFEVLEGDPVKQILERAATLPADILVIATHGHGGFERLVLGSVTEKILRKATCPVLTVPNPPDRAVRTPGMLFSSVLCPVDFTETSGRALALAADFVEQTKSHLTVLHVLENLPEEDPRALMHFNIPEYRSFLELEAREKMKSLVSGEIRARVPVETRIVGGKAWVETLKVAREVEAGLIVMGVQGRTPFDLALFGSTANQLSRKAPCPVLTLRTP